MTEGEKCLSVRELLKSTYEKLSQKHNNREIKFNNKVLTEIVDDSDWHRIVKGYMCYDSARIFQFKNRVWLIAMGEREGGYPAELYDSDIIALDFSLEDKALESKEELAKKIEEGSYFKNSLIYGVSDGNLGISNLSRFGKQIIDLLGSRILEFVYQKPEYDDEYFLSSTLGPLCKKSARYRPEFADFLAELFESVLTS